MILFLKIVFFVCHITFEKSVCPKMSEHCLMQYSTTVSKNISASLKLWVPGQGDEICRCTSPCCLADILWFKSATYS